METLQSVLMGIPVSTKNDYSTTLAQLVLSMTDLSHVRTDKGEMVLTKAGFKQLVTDRLGFNEKSLDHPRLRPETKLAIMQDLVRESNDEILVRGSGNRIEAVLSADYNIFDNVSILENLRWLMSKGHIPSDVMVMSKSIDPQGRNMHLRIVSPSNWDFEITENGVSRLFRGNLVLSNNELGSGAFKANVAITRNACLNTTIGAKLFSVDHRGGRFGSKDEFMEQLIRAVSLIKDYTSQMHQRMLEFQNVRLSDPILVFEKIAEEMGVPKYAMAGAQSYYAENQGDNLYDAVQSVSAGLRAVDPSPMERARLKSYSRAGDPDKRFALEERLWEIANRLRDTDASGEGITEHYRTEAERIREAAANYTESFADRDDLAPAIAQGIRGLEVI